MTGDPPGGLLCSRRAHPAHAGFSLEPLDRCSACLMCRMVTRALVKVQVLTPQGSWARDSAFLISSPALPMLHFCGAAPAGRAPQRQWLSHRGAKRNP